MINEDPIFSKAATSEIYEYTKKNQSNVLHIKGIKAKQNENATALAEEMKAHLEKLNPQWLISNSYASITAKGTWSNVTFANYEDTISAFTTLKNTKEKFRDSLLFGSVRNVKDLRTVVMSVIRKDADENKVREFLNKLAAQSAKNTQIVGEEPTRKYEYFSFNIIESKTFYKND